MIIQNERLTYSQLIKKIRKAYPDGKVKDFQLIGSFIRALPKGTSLISQRRVKDREKKFRLFGWDIILKKKKWESLFLGEFVNPENILIESNHFVVKGYRWKQQYI
jgi:hypothetical protein